MTGVAFSMRASFLLRSAICLSNTSGLLDRFQSHVSSRGTPTNGSIIWAAVDRDVVQVQQNKACRRSVDDGNATERRQIHHRLRRDRSLRRARIVDEERHE